MMIRSMTLGGVAALALFGAAQAQPGMAMAPGSTMPMAGQALPTPQYLTAAAQSDMFEIQEGQLAQRMGKSSQVRSFGAQMVRDHTKSTQMLMATVTKEGMTPPPPPPLRPDQQQMISQLQAMSGSDFDKMYVQQQLQAHQEALQLHQSYAQSGDDKALRKTAHNIVPVVQQHLSMLQSMSSM